ncbi:hypothetical protein [Nocardia asteroides]|uniref:hypothetical protein n=1 Tax=Nocardia asteroides TaxID=1824 RepID=UPI001E38C8B3|nr:hypothetical protein [Nocardia asteroides]UGT64562.1 hypothetical protein LTT61_15290 [Nocardia asteroides]
MRRAVVQRAALLMTAIGAVAGCASGAGDFPGTTSTLTVVRTTNAVAAVDSNCGSLTYPQTGNRVTVTVATGRLTCAEARAVFDRYLNDSTVSHTGNTWAAEFDGWICVTPTATAAQIEQIAGECDRDDAKIVAR